jgi:hypothetical protein
MNQIHPHPLWLGHAGDGRDARRILDADIKAVVHLAAEEPSPQLPRDLLFFRFPVIDGADNSNHLMLLALGTVSHLLTMRLPTLVYCSAGMSRSPAIAAGAIALVTGTPPDECLREIAQHRATDVSPGLWASVKGYCQRIRNQTGVPQDSGQERSSRS